jgi:cation:H+ antiporter
VLGLAFLAGAGALLSVGADLSMARVGALAIRLRVSALAIALLIAGAELEELVTVVIASSQHRSGIAAGDAIGANVTMLTLVLGALALLQPLPLTPRLRPYTAVACVASTVGALLMVGGSVSRPEGATLVVGYLAFVVWVLAREHRAAARARDRELFADDPVATAPDAANAAIALLGLACVALGGWLAVAGADRVVAGLGLSESGVGLTLVALATSAELFALIWAARRHRVTELALVALVGSVVANATATVGAGAFVQPLSTSGTVAAAWLAAGIAALLLVPQLWEARWTRLVGAALIATYAAYGVVALS